MKLRSLFKKKKKAVKTVVKKKSPKPRKKAPKKAKAVKKAPKKRVKKAATIEINKNECPECGSMNVVISKMTGNTICQDCGAILAGLPPDVEKQFANVKKQH
jgi:ribosomal protein S27E